jgi:NAD(P)-dependent dehydrogenase (short-subunit alcohol dehydrogenase family)
MAGGGAVWFRYEDWAARLVASSAAGTLDQDLAWVEQMVGVNVLSYVYLSSYALPHLALPSSGLGPKNDNRHKESGGGGGGGGPRGRIVAVGSAAGKQGLPRVAPYAMTKHAVFGYFDSLRQDLVASPDPGLARVGITTGVLGSFDTPAARAATKGKLDEGAVAWHPPSQAASGLLLGCARGLRTVYVPWSQTRLAGLLHPLAPAAMDWVVRLVTLSGE